jgi:hypothetical protein
MPAVIRLLVGETRRARDTADHLARGLVDRGVSVIGPDVAFALRNPDLYVSGTRVNMVSSADALAAQVEGLEADEVFSLDFFPEFFASPDRIGWWLGHESPPGEGMGGVAARMRAFVASLDDPTSLQHEVVIAVTHSPIVRVVGLDLLGHDIGEPGWNSGLLLTVTDGRILAETFEPEVVV